jgi:two-component system phosphate regulon sensor histidine kinase PhoR
LFRNTAVLISAGCAVAAALVAVAVFRDGPRTALLVTALLLCIGLALLSFVSARVSARSWRELSAAARRITAGDTGARLPFAPEPARDAFNEMAARLQSVHLRSEEERNRLVAALNSSGDAILGVDRDGRVAFANAEAEKFFTAAEGEVIGQPLVWALPNEDVRQALRAGAETGKRQTVTIERPNRQHLRVIVAPMERGGLWSCVIVVRDLTDVYRVDRVRREFVANVSHELRTPLASIKAVIQTLQAGAMADEAAASDFLSRADEEVDRLVRIVEELLEISRTEAGEAPLDNETSVDMGALVRRAAGRLLAQAERQGLTMTVEIADEPLSVNGNAERLERAVINLLHNALKFTPAGGTVTARVEPDDGWVTVRVRDTGVGILAEDLPRIFERFFKADRARQGGGTGLGLALVKHTVEAYGGKVAATSKPERGSEFTISIPAAP